MSDSESKAVAAAAQGKCPSCGAPRADLSTPCPKCHAPALGPSDPAKAAGDARRGVFESLMTVRSSDIEPYTGLRYLSKLFKLMAIIMLLLLIAEVVTGFIAQGSTAVPTLLSETSRLIVLAGMLWGIGDLAILLIDIGHDVRAARILLGRQAAHLAVDSMEETTNALNNAGVGKGAPPSGGGSRS